MNSIRRLPNSSSTINTSWAIRAKASQSTLYGIKVNNVWGEFRVHQCDNGILIDGGYYSEIEKGKFFNIAHTAIKQQNTSPWPWWNNNTPQINLSNNDIRNATIGIDLYNTGNTLSRIESNSIVNTPYREKSVAIRAQNIIGKITDCKGMRWLTIRHNESRRFKTGIQSDICNCLEISNNQIYLNNPNWDQAHGIWVRSSLGALIDNNNVYGSGMQWYSQGIRLEFSPQTTLSCNYVNNTENALWIHNNNNFSTIIGNTLMNYKYGLHLTYNGLIGSQLISGTVKYDLFNSFDLTPGGPDVDLFTSLSTFGPNSPFCFRSSIISNVISGSIGPDPISKDLANNLTQQNFCGTATQPFNSNYPIIAGVYANENRWITKFKYAQVLKASADSASQLFNNPYMINQVNDSINTTVAEDILELDSLIEQKYWNEAWGKIYSTNPTHPIEELNLSTSEIVLKYLPVLWNGQDTTVNSGDVNWLFDVANRCPYQWGEVVFQARIFIHRYIDADAVFVDNCLPYTPNAPRLMQPEVDDEVYVYPNPATEVLYVYTGNNEAFNYIIYDMQGRIVKQEAMKQPVEVISIEGLQAGCYYITLYDGTIHKTLPFVKN
ncbi:MAG: T9SS type A sorting domain-containing protein [Candidatus Competibacteraceae bacterium]|nr:T9SS type A sorting domain-containing protein [Candidatus Competibacteraceae bacterium]